jgi:hypothetical protein
MDIRLHCLETFEAQGSDGQRYKVRAYERLVRDESLPLAAERWEPSGIAEFRLDDGAPLEGADDGSLRMRSGVVLTRQ